MVASKKMDFDMFVARVEAVCNGADIYVNRCEGEWWEIEAACSHVHARYNAQVARQGFARVDEMFQAVNHGH